MEKNIFNGKEAQYLVNYFQSIGVMVEIGGDSRIGGCYYPLEKRIQIGKNASSDNIVPILLHEFAHHIHFQLEPFWGGGHLKVIFDDDYSSVKNYRTELLEVTFFVADKTLGRNLKNEVKNKLKNAEKRLLPQKQRLQEEILEFEKIIKDKYPNFRRSKKFPECNSYLEKSEAQYLLESDYVCKEPGSWKKKTSWWKYATVWKNVPGWRHFELHIDNIETDFPNMPKEFVAYIRLKSHQRKISLINSNLSMTKKCGSYFSSAAELFARLVEGLYIDKEQVKKLAPNAYKRFYELLNAGYYKELHEVFVNLNLI